MYNGWHSIRNECAALKNKKFIMRTLINLTIAFCLLLVCSCKKFLQEKPTSFLSPSSNLSSTKVARALANSCYTDLPGLLSGQASSYGGNTYNLLEFMTGKANSDLGQTEFVSFQTLQYNSTSFYMDTWWQHLYLGVGSCNLALQQLPKVTAGGLTDAAKTNMLAEAHTLRAMYYFYLVRLYGAVPNVTTVPVSLNLNLPRSAAKNIYDSIIIPDLLIAEKSTLPWSDQT